jgi:hypothetical protein
MRTALALKPLHTSGNIPSFIWIVSVWLMGPNDGQWIVLLLHFLFPFRSQLSRFKPSSVRNSHRLNKSWHKHKRATESVYLLLSVVRKERNAMPRGIQSVKPSCRKHANLIMCRSLKKYLSTVCGDLVSTVSPVEIFSVPSSVFFLSGRTRGIELPDDWSSSGHAALDYVLLHISQFHTGCIRYSARSSCHWPSIVLRENIGMVTSFCSFSQKKNFIL